MLYSCFGSSCGCWPHFQFLPSPDRPLLGRGPCGGNAATLIERGAFFLYAMRRGFCYSLSLFRPPLRRKAELLFLPFLAAEGRMTFSYLLLTSEGRTAFPPPHGGRLNCFFSPPPSGDSVGIRTRDPQLRRLLLYPAELRNLPAPDRMAAFSGCKDSKSFRKIVRFVWGIGKFCLHLQA